MISRADRRLIDAIAERGLSVTARQLERWRQAGLIPKPIVTSLGRGRGKDSDYPEGTVEQTTELIQILEEHRSFAVALMVLFARGFSVDEDALRMHYRRIFEGIDGGLAGAVENFDGDPADPFDRADAAAVAAVSRSPYSALGRVLRERVDRVDRERSVKDLLLDVLRDIFYAFQVGTVYAESDTDQHFDKSVEAILEVGGLAATARDIVPGLGRPMLSSPPVQEGRAVLAAIPLARGCLDRADLRELERARDELRLLLAFVRAAHSVLSRTTGEPDAYGFGAVRGSEGRDDVLVALGSPMWLAVKEKLGMWRGVADQLAMMKVQLPMLQASASLLDELPEYVWPLLAPGNESELSSMPEEERLKIDAITRRWAKEHPEQARLIQAEP